VVARGLKGVLSTFRKATPVIQEGKEEQIEEQVKEKQLLGQLKKANEINLDISQRKRKMERVLAAVLQMRTTHMPHTCHTAPHPHHRTRCQRTHSRRRCHSKSTTTTVRVVRDCGVTLEGDIFVQRTRQNLAHARSIVAQFWLLTSQPWRPVEGRRGSGKEG